MGNEKSGNRGYTPKRLPVFGMLKKCSDEYGIDLIEIVGGDTDGEGKTFL